MQRQHAGQLGVREIAVQNGLDDFAGQLAVRGQGMGEVGIDRLQDKPVRFDRVGLKASRPQQRRTRSSALERTCGCNKDTRRCYPRRGSETRGDGRGDRRRHRKQPASC